MKQTFLQDEAKRKQDRLQADLSVIKVRLRELESANESLTEKAGAIKQQLREHTDISEDRYYELRGTADDLLTVKDLLAVSTFLYSLGVLLLLYTSLLKIFILLFCIGVMSFKCCAHTH